MHITRSPQGQEQTAERTERYSQHERRTAMKITRRGIAVPRNGILHSAERVAQRLEQQQERRPLLPFIFFRVTAAEDSEADCGVPCPSLSAGATASRNSSVVALSRRYQVAYATDCRDNSRFYVLFCHCYCHCCNREQVQ
jgi:hypothetical protein